MESPRPVAAFAAVLLAVACAPSARGPARLVFVRPVEAPRAAGESAATTATTAPIVRASREPGAGALRIVSDTEAVLDVGPFAMTLRLVEREARPRAVERILRGDPAPFLPLLESRRLITFLMDVRNGSRERLEFNPQLILLAQDRPQDLRHPLDATEAWEALRAAGRSEETLLSELPRAIYDTAVTLRQGESISRLLVFHAPALEARSLVLGFESFSLGGAMYSFSVPLRQIPGPPLDGPSAPREGSAP